MKDEEYKEDSLNDKWLGEEFICVQNAHIDNAAFNLIRLMLQDIHEAKWDAEVIGDIVDYAEHTLLKKGLKVCYPYYDDADNICYKSNDRCSYCKKLNGEG